MIFNMACGGGKPRITYTGAYTTQSYTADGKPYTLYTLTGSGTLTVRGRARHAGVWLCGGPAVEAVRWDFVTTLARCHLVTREDCERARLPKRLLTALYRLFSPVF